MPPSHFLKVFVSYAHADDEHLEYLKAHLDQLQVEGLISSWTDREIPAGDSWDETIKTKLEHAQIIVLLVSKRFLESTYVKTVEIPLAIKRERQGHAKLVCVIVDECNWKPHFASYQVLPPGATPVTGWPHRDSAYAIVARNIGAVVTELRKSIDKQVRHERTIRNRRIFQHTRFRVAGEDYDPFRAFQQVFLRSHLHSAAAQFPLDAAAAQQTEFIGLDYQTIFAKVRDSTVPPGLNFDLIAIPYFLLGHCVERNLVQPLDKRLNEFETRFAWWQETCSYGGCLYGVPLSSLTMLLAIRKDLFDTYDLQKPDTWTQYMALIDAAIERRLPVAPALLQGRHHITLWYDWLNHLYAHDTSDLALYGASRKTAHDAAEDLRAGTRSYLTLASKLARQPPTARRRVHWSTSNWDSGIEAFARGELLTTLVFNDALDTLRRRMETGPSTPFMPVEYLPIPRAEPSGHRNGQVEGWILCVPTGARYAEAANDVLEWFLQHSTQRAYALFGGASGHLEVIDEEAARTNDGGAGLSFKRSVESSQSGQTAIDLVKHNGPRALEVIDLIRADLYDAVLAVGCSEDDKKIDKAVDDATGELVKRVKERLAARGG